VWGKGFTTVDDSIANLASGMNCGGGHHSSFLIYNLGWFSFSIQISLAVALPSGAKNVQRCTTCLNRKKEEESSWVV
jgi:hypothetical protein